jgi:ribonuclease D
LNHSLPPIYCTTPDSLQQAVATLALSSRIAVDLEFDSNSYGYGLTPSLIQLATTEACFVVDLMTGLDVSALFALLTDERIQKLVHSPGEDLRVLHSLSCFPKHLFDTEIVARLLNYEQTSLANLLNLKLGIQLGKGQQRSNWLQRPLSEKQLDYAAADVQWLHSLQQVLVAEAEEKGLMPWVAEEQAALNTIVVAPNNGEDFLKPADRKTLSPWHQHVLNHLLRYRDSLARQLGRPAYQVMSEDLVRGLAAGERKPEDLMTDSSVHPRLRNLRSAVALGYELHSSRAEATAQNLAQQRLRSPRPAPSAVARQQKAVHYRDHLFTPIQQVLKERFGLYATQFLLSNRLIGDLVYGKLRLTDLPPYRAALFGDIAAQLGLDWNEYKEA